MRKIFVTLFSCCIVLMTTAQVQFPTIDKSPMDVCYYPNTYPILKIQNKTTDPLLARVLYSRPQKNGRVIFGDLIEYGKIWRLGANEATEIDLFNNVKIGDKKVKKGRYTIYCIPYASKWTIIFNKETDTWGSFQYDQTKDVLRIDVPVEKNSVPVEAFSMIFEKTTNGINLNMAWDDVKVAVPISL